MRITALVAAVLGASLLLPQAWVEAASYTLPGAGVQLWHPDDWQARYENDELMLTSPGDHANMIVSVAADGQVDAALAELETSLAARGVTDVEPVESQERVINGMSAELKSARARYEGQPIEMGIGFIS